MNLPMPVPTPAFDRFTVVVSLTARRLICSGVEDEELHPGGASSAVC